MARVTESEVKEIIETDVTPLTVFISQAALLVSETLEGKGLSEARLKEIERYLAAHYLAATLDPQARSEGASGTSVTYEGAQGMGLQGTRYGQQALVWDTTGTLRELNGQERRPRSGSSITLF